MRSKTLLKVFLAVVVVIVSGSLWINLRSARHQITDPQNLENQESQGKISIARSTSLMTPAPPPEIAAPTAPAVAVQVSESGTPPPPASLPLDVQRAMLASVLEDPPGMPTLNQVMFGGGIQEQRRVEALARFFGGNTDERRVEALAQSDRIATAAVAVWNSGLHLTPDQIQSLNAITVAELRRETEDSLRIMSRAESMDLVSASRLRVETVTRQHDTLLRILEKATPFLTPEQSKIMSSMFEFWLTTRMLKVRVEEGLPSSGR